MTWAFYLDGTETVTLLTQMAPESRTWNGFSVPNPTPRELVRYLDDLRKELDEGAYWDMMQSVIKYYGEGRGLDEPIRNVDGFTWMMRRVFNPTLTQMNMTMARGHMGRKGHELVGYYVPAEGHPEEWNVEKLVRTCCPPEVGETQRVVMGGLAEVRNLPDYAHQYVGRRFTYLPGVPSMSEQKREPNLVVRAGDTVEVAAVFRNWNGVEHLDMMYVRNLSSENDIHHTHVTPGDLGLPSLHASEGEHFFEGRTA